MKKFFTYQDPVVSVHRPRTLVQAALAQGVRRDALFQDTGLTPGMLDVPETQLSYAQFGLLIRNALRLTGNAALGLDVGRNTRAPQMGMLGFAMMSSETVAAAFTNWENAGAQFGKLFPDNSKEGGNTRAKAAIWQNRKDFDVKLAVFSKAVADGKPKANSLEGLKAAMPAINDGCNNCHELYRAPAKK